MFGVQAHDFLPTYVGNEDVGDLVRDSINLFQQNGLVGAQGDMGCERFFGTSNVEWAIY